MQSSISSERREVGSETSDGRVKSRDLRSCGEGDDDGVCLLERD